MDEKIKTLKDFGETVYDHISERVYTIEELRGEARKWLKHLEQEDKHWKLEPRLAIRDWIRHFFNLEDDN